MLNDSFGDGRLFHGITYDGPQGKPLVITTAPYMQMPIEGNPADWMAFALQGMYGEYALVRHPPLERYDILNALSVMEVLRQPSMSLDTRGMRIGLVSSEKMVQDIKDGPSVYPMHAIKGRLYGWKLWAVEPKVKGELCLHFIETGTMRCESWQLMLADDRGVIPELTIWKTNNHHYDYQCTDNGNWVEVHEWFGPCDNSDEELVRTFQIAPDGKWIIYENDI